MLQALAVSPAANNQLSQAYALVEDALSQHPESQELVSMLALISEARQEWAKASFFLERLVRLQGSGVTAETLNHWVRVLRCQGQIERAARLAGNALKMYPGHVMLESESQTLNSILAVKSAQAGA
jgi:uncharacterized protein HemY